jgi:hypothetical protein
MSTNIVHQHGTDHLKVSVAVAAHRAGDLVCEQGFFGTVQDDVAVGDPFTLLLDPTVTYARVASTLAAGVIVTAPATAQATTLPIGAAGAATLGIPVGATAGWVPFGKVIATGTATTAKIQHFNPNPYRVTMP